MLSQLIFVFRSLFSTVSICFSYWRGSFSTLSWTHELSDAVANSLAVVCHHPTRELEIWSLQTKWGGSCVATLALCFRGGRCEDDTFATFQLHLHLSFFRGLLAIFSRYDLTNYRPFLTRALAELDLRSVCSCIQPSVMFLKISQDLA